MFVAQLWKTCVKLGSLDTTGIEQHILHKTTSNTLNRMLKFRKHCLDLTLNALGYTIVRVGDTFGVSNEL